MEAATSFWSLEAGVIYLAACAIVNAVATKTSSTILMESAGVLVPMWVRTPWMTKPVHMLLAWMLLVKMASL